MHLRRLIPSAVIGVAAVGGLGTWIQATRAHDVPDVESRGVLNAVSRADVTLDLRRQQLIGVRTVRVVRGTLEHVTRAGGQIRAAEPRLFDINLKADGWIQELAVDHTGQRVHRGQPLLTFYSPEVLTVQTDYLLALRTRDQVMQSAPDARPQADVIVTAARRKLEQLDVPPEEIRALEQSRVATGIVRLPAPVDGFVIEKQAMKGLHAAAGQTLFKVADLSVVWIEAEIYENELADVAIGASATVTIDAYPDQTFAARVAHIYPYLEDKTRSTRVQLEIPNRDERLKPGMYARVELKTAGGVGLTVPVDAVLDSGAEQIVFVAHGDGRFEPRPIRIGRRFDDTVQILQGINEGESVATGAAFFLDSESQMRAAFQPADVPAPAPGSNIVLRTNPDPPTTGENRFEVLVTDANGLPVDNADVLLQLHMPAMPAMNMPAMQSEARPMWVGHGVYRGTGPIMMAGRWNATVVVRSGERRLGTLERPMLVR